MNVRKINDKLPVPKLLLSNIGLNKGDYVIFEQIDDYIIIKKCDLPLEEAEKLYKSDIKENTVFKKKNNIVEVEIKQTIKEKIEKDKERIKSTSNINIYEQKTTSRNEVNIPAKIFKDMNLSEKSYTSKLESIDDNHIITLTLDDNSTTKFRKSNTLSINELSKLHNFKTKPGTPLILEKSSDNQIKLLFKSKDIIESKLLKDTIQEIEKTISKTKSKPKPISISKNPISYDEARLQRRSRLQNEYDILLTKSKRNKSYIKFIDKDKLPKDQTICYICKAKLTEQDDSMISSKRVCKVCKHKELKKFFKPLYDMACLREQIELIDKEIEQNKQTNL